jgi:light-regulated signal transduction histidine kinase (bacteriophytochrome)
MAQKLIQKTLKDLVAEKSDLENYQKALLNILDDYNEEKEILRANQNALLNILEDYMEEQKKVKSANDELMLLNAELEDFAYTVSHDLRSPVRAINGFTSIISDRYSDKFDTEGKELLYIIINETVRMGQLIDNLLKFARLGKHEIKKSLTDMTALAQDSVNKIISMSERKCKAVIRVHNLPEAYCEKPLIQEVFLNLISNAIKFSAPVPDPVIEIGYLIREGTGFYYVKDNGIGFDMRFYNKLFGVFQRLHSTEEFEGNGIGLAVVRRIVVRHGGTVFAESKLNKGSVFCFSMQG